MSKILIFEPDPKIRMVVESAFIAEGLEETRFIDQIPKNYAGDTILICLCDKDESLTGAPDIPVSHIFKKPLRLGALIDFVRRLIRQGANVRSAVLTIGPYDLDTAHNLLMRRESKEQIRLTEKETNILRFLHEHESRHVTRQDLLDHVWGYVQGVETHTLETHIYRLRRKIEKDAAAPEILLTEENGYRLGL